MRYRNLAARGARREERRPCAERRAATTARMPPPGIVAAITKATGLSQDDVWVVFEEVAARDWYVGATDVETRRKTK